jgi:hypothetical protein
MLPGLVTFSRDFRYAPPWLPSSLPEHNRTLTSMSLPFQSFKELLKYALIDEDTERRK